MPIKFFELGSGNICVLAARKNNFAIFDIGVNVLCDLVHDLLPKRGFNSEFFNHAIRWAGICHH